MQEVDFRAFLTGSELATRLAEIHGYKKLNSVLAAQARKFYMQRLPQIRLDGDEIELRTMQGTLIAKGFKRIVIGDYGAYVEIDKSQMVRENVRCKPGQEFRFRNPQFKERVKYYWYTATDDSDVKIYYQQRGVTYADYKPGMFYVSPDELDLTPF